MTVRRFHDIGLEGKVYFKLKFISGLIGLTAIFVLVLSIFLKPIFFLLSLLFGGLYFIFSLGLMLYSFVKLSKEGQGKPNDFGDVPKYYMY